MSTKYTLEEVSTDLVTNSILIGVYSSQADAVKVAHDRWGEIKRNVKGKRCLVIRHYEGNRYQDIIFTLGAE